MNTLLEVRERSPAQGRPLVKVGPGEHHVTGDPEAAIVTVLGSCVAACIRDPAIGVGGLNHFMLPESKDGVWGKASASLRYGNFAMERLINDILSRGGKRARLEVKLFGGGRLAQQSGGVGERNAAYVEAYLRTEGIVPLVSEMGRNWAVRLIYLPVSGRAFLQDLPEGTSRVSDVEARFERALPRRMPVGTIDLFS